MKQKNNHKESIFSKPYLLILTFSIAIFTQVTTFDYTGFDDDFLIVNNLQQLKNWDNLTKIFTDNSFLSDAVYGFYRPLQTLTFMIDAHLSSNNLFVFHITNLILHIITTFLLYKLLLKLKLNVNISSSLSLIYAINPLFISTVSWLPARGDLLLTLFTLASFINFIEFLNTRKILHLIFNIIFFTLALFSKETAVILPLIFIIYYLFKKNLTNIKHLFLPITLWLVIGLIWFNLRNSSVTEFPENQIFGLIPFFENIPTFVEYLAKFIIPIKIDLLPIYSLTNTIIGLIILLLLIFSLIKFKKIRTYLIFGLLWYLLFVFPGTLYSRNYPLSVQFYQYLDHRAYLPIIGILISVGYLLQEIIPQKLNRNYTIYSMVITILFAIITFINLKYYKNPEIFLTKAIEQNPQSSVANFLLANYFKDNLKYNDAIDYYTKALKINPNYPEALNNRGILFALQNKLNLALKDLNKAIKLSPDIPDGYYNRAMIWETSGKIDEAIIDYKKALKTRPNDKIILLSLSNLYLQKKEFQQSQKILNEILKIDPNYYLAYYNLANLYLDIGNYQEAIKYYTQTINFKPNYTNAYINRANAYWNLKQYDSACKDWLNASNQGDKNAQIMYNNYCNQKK